MKWRGEAKGSGLALRAELATRDGGRLRRGFFDTVLIKALGLCAELGIQGHESIPSLQAETRLSVSASCWSWRVLLESSPEYVMVFAPAVRDPAGS